MPATESNVQISEERCADFSKRTLNCDAKIPLVFSSRVGDHTGVLAFVEQHGVFYDEAVAELLNASMDAPSQQLQSTNVADTLVNCNFVL